MTMPAIDADEYPVLPTEFSGPDLVLDAEAFRAALTQTLPCVSVDSSRGVLTNLRCAVKDGQLTLVATDAYRLAIATLPVEAPDQMFLLPACNAARLERALPKSGPVTVTFSPYGGQLRASCTGCVFIAQLSSEQFVNYQQIIPKAPPVRFAVSAEVLARCLALVGKVDFVRLGGGTAMPDLLVSSPDQSANAAAPAMWGEPLVIGANRQYLLDLCKVAGKGKLTMATHGPTMAMLWTVDTLPAYFQVIMSHGLLK
jgi:DNA polymerase-3 subunit beta